MNVAVTVWNGRISPVFDVARNFLVLTVENGMVVDTRLERFDDSQPMQRPAHLSALCVHTLICGAISRPLAELMASLGIQTLSFISGETEKVINAFLAGSLPSPTLAMPGCGARHRSPDRRFSGLADRRGSGNGPRRQGRTTDRGGTDHARQR